MPRFNNALHNQIIPVPISELAGYDRLAVKGNETGTTCKGNA